MTTTANPGVVSAGASLAPTDGTDQQMLDHLNASQRVTAYCHAVLNTVVNPVTPPDDTPDETKKMLKDWYAKFTTDLVNAQGHATSWINDIGPRVNATVPQSIIDYSNLFKATTDEILRILNDSNMAPNEPQRGTIVTLLKALHKQLGAQEDSLTSLLQDLKTFSTHIIDDHKNLLEGQNGAQKIINLDQQTIDSITGQIAKINEAMQKDDTAVLMSFLGLGLAIFVCVCAFAIAVATGGAAAPIVVCAVAGLGVAASITTAVVYSDKVNAELAELHKQQAELTDVQAQVAALQGITNSIDGLKNQNEAAQKAMSAVLASYTTLNQKLTAVITLLSDADTAKSAFDQLVDITASQASWNQLAEFAQKIEDTYTQMQVIVLTHQSAAKAA